MNEYLTNKLLSVCKTYRVTAHKVHRFPKIQPFWLLVIC